MLRQDEVHNDLRIKSECANQLRIRKEEITAVSVEKRSLDARPKVPIYRLSCNVYVNENPPELKRIEYVNLSDTAPVVHIIGFGPAGMFAALRLIEHGIKPVIFERGKPVQERRRDIRNLMQEHNVNPESNYCFGEGGAGTFSDGKLYTRSTKKGDVKKILRVLNSFGASADILIDAHPHIGSNVLPKIVVRIRETIISCGGEIHFNSKLTDIKYADNKIQSIVINDTEEHECGSLILATGHSARDIYNLFNTKKLFIEPKPFAVGFRIEHSQEYINELRYRSKEHSHNLPAAEYSFTCQSEGRGAFSFCMCPGGIVVPASTAGGELVLNGMSVSKRNSRFANSGFVVTVDEKDWSKEFQDSPLAGMQYQAGIEGKAFQMTSSQRAPAQRAIDFIDGVESKELPESSYIPGLESINLNNLFSKSVSTSLKHALQAAEIKMKGYSNGLLLAPETRTSSPVRITRNSETRQHTQVQGLFPVGEGAGYAGGIMSAAIDGELSADSAAGLLGISL